MTPPTAWLDREVEPPPVRSEIRGQVPSVVVDPDEPGAPPIGGARGRSRSPRPVVIEQVRGPGRSPRRRQHHEDDAR